MVQFALCNTDSSLMFLLHFGIIFDLFLLKCLECIFFGCDITLSIGYFIRQICFRKIQLALQASVVPDCGLCLLKFQLHLLQLDFGFGDLLLQLSLLDLQLINFKFELENTRSVFADRMLGLR